MREQENNRVVYQFTYLVKAMLLLSMAYLLFIGMLSLSNPLALDDYCAIHAIQKHGYWGSIQHWFSQWSGRFSSIFLTNTILYYRETIPTIILYPIFLSVLYISGLYRIFNLCLPQVLKKWWISLSLSTYCFSIFLMTTYDLGAFFWISGSCSHYVGLAFGFWLISELFSSRTSLLSYPILIISSLFIGGAGENFALLVVIGLLFFTYLRYSKKVSISFPKLLVVTAVCLLAFCLSISAAGTGVRLEDGGERSWVGLLKSMVQSFGYFIDAYELPRLGTRLILLLPFLFVGSYWSSSQLIIIFKNYWKIFFGFILLVFTSFIPSIYALTYLGTARTLSYANLLIIIFIAFSYIVLGNQLKVSQISFSRLTILSSVLFTFLILKSWVIQFPDSRRYVDSLNDRLEKIQAVATQEEGDLLKLEKLYYSPWVVYEVHQFKEDPSFFGNSCTKAVLKIPFDLKVDPADRRIPKHPLSN